MLPPLKIAIATQSCYAHQNKPWRDDEALCAYLKKKGHDATIIDWQDSAFNPTQYDAIFVSTTWNIPAHSNDFISWLDMCEADKKKRLINTKQILTFGLKKDIYYAFLNTQESLKPHLIPTRFVTSENKTGFDKKFIHSLSEEDGFAGHNLVIKPIISADGYQTYFFGNNAQNDSPYFIPSIDEAEKICHDILDHAHLRGLMVQPYIKGIENGEYSLTYLRGKLALCIKKNGGFRNDKSINRIAIDTARLHHNIRDVANNASKALIDKFGIDHLTRYRIDIIRDGDTTYISELELVEPNCNFGVTFNNSDHNYSFGTLVAQLGDAILQTAYTF